MKTYIKLNEDGVVVSMYKTSLDSLDIELTEEQAAGFRDDVVFAVHNGAQVIQPTVFHKWNSHEGTWYLDLQLAKDNKINEINKERDSLENAGFLAYGYMFDSDPVSKARITIAALSAMGNPTFMPMLWTTADNQIVSLSREQLIELPSIMAAYGNELHVSARLRKELVYNCNSLEELYAI